MMSLARALDLRQDNAHQLALAKAQHLDRWVNSFKGRAHSLEKCVRKATKREAKDQPISGRK